MSENENAVATEQTTEKNETQNTEEVTEAVETQSPATAQGIEENIDETAAPAEKKEETVAPAEKEEKTVAPAEKEEKTVAPAEKEEKTVVPEEQEEYEISYHAVEKEGAVTAIWEMQGPKHIRTIDPRSNEGKKILSLFETVV